MRINYENKSGDILNAPYRKYPNDAAYDLFAAENVTIPAWGRGTVDTGIRMQIPQGFAGLILSRSGLAKNGGLFVLNAPGLIDAGYSDTIKVVLGNFSDEEFRIHDGMRICQLMIIRLDDYYFSPGTVWGGERGENGFGSTGN